MNECIDVVAAILRDSDGRVLVTRRPPGRHLAGMWEFPGGKVEADESPEQALGRELDEELGVRPGAVRPLASVRHSYPEKTVRLNLFEIHGFDGDPSGREGQPLRWIAPGELNELEMPPADRPLARLLDLDGYYAISPAPSVLGEAAFIDGWRRCLEAGFRLLRLRPAPDEPVSDSLVKTIDEMCRDAGARWIASGDLGQCFGWPADGLHLSTRQLLTLDRRPLDDDKLLIASCHDLEEIRIAESLDVDMVTLSPVQVTSSHPEAKPLGWDDFERVLRYATLPVLALGGMQPDDWMRARRAGAFGVAGIRAFGWDQAS